MIGSRRWRFGLVEYAKIRKQMPQLLFRVMGPDNQQAFDEVVETLCKRFDYPEVISDPEKGWVNNPQSKLAWLRDTMRNRTRQEYHNQKRQDAQEANPGDPGLS